MARLKKEEIPQCTSSDFTKVKVKVNSGKSHSEKDLSPNVIPGVIERVKLGSKINFA